MNHLFEYHDGGRSKYFRMKYKKDQVGDCVIRALAIATKEDYKSVRNELWDTSRENGYMPNSKENYEQFLAKRGWKWLKKIKGYNLGAYPVPQNITAIVSLAGHLCCLDQGVVYDLWDCRKKYPYGIYVHKSQEHLVKL